MRQLLSRPIGMLLVSILGSIIAYFMIDPLKHIWVVVWNGVGYIPRLYQASIIQLAASRSYMLAIYTSLLGFLSIPSAIAFVGLVELGMRLRRRLNPMLEDEPSKREWSDRVVWWMFGICVVLTLSVFALLASEPMTGLIACSITTSFDQRLTILRPSISEQQFMVFEADWAKMKTQSDYQRLVREMDGLATQKHITLPDVPFK